MNVGAVTRANKIPRQRGDCFKRRECSFGRIVSEGGQRRIELVDHVEVFAVRMKRQVPWSSTGVKHCGRLLGGPKFAASRIEPVDHHFVGSEGGGDREAIGAVELDAMGVCRLLWF